MKIDEPRLWVFRVVTGHQLDGWSGAPTTDAVFFHTSASPLATMIVRHTARRMIPFLVLETKGKCTKMVAQMEYWQPEYLV